jgi:hypothetical protein
MFAIAVDLLSLPAGLKRLARSERMLDIGRGKGTHRCKSGAEDAFSAQSEALACRVSGSTKCELSAKDTIPDGGLRQSVLGLMWHDLTIAFKCEP